MNPNISTFDMVARIKQDTKALLTDGTTFNIWNGETFPIERVGNGGIYIRTVFGEGFIAYASFSYHEEADESDPSYNGHPSSFR